MKQGLTFTQQRFFNPVNNIDLRAVIYHRACRSRIGFSAIIACLKETVMTRPQLDRINGRPC